MNLQEVRDAIRAQLEIPDEEDLSTTLLDLYIREGYDRTMAFEPRWPFFQSSWMIANTGGATTITLPSDARQDQIMTLRQDGGERLTQIGYEMADANFPDEANSSVPTYFSVWGGEIHLWPIPTEEYDYTLRGYRKTSDWVSDGATAEVDADTRLHMPIVHYAISLAYAQQEDEVLEMSYMQRWNANLDRLHHDIMAPPHHRPLVYGAGLVGGTPYAQWSWDLSDV